MPREHPHLPHSALDVSQISWRTSARIDPVFAITGGTGPYRYARGEGHQEDKLRILDLDM
jgi:hypothetical protein